MSDDLPIQNIIEDYDDLMVSEILNLLNDLYDDELDVVRAAEASGKNRPALLNEIDRLRGAAIMATAPEPKKKEVSLPTRDECLLEAYKYLVDIHGRSDNGRVGQGAAATAWIALAAEIRADDEKFERLRESLQDHDTAESHNQ